jgi:hypothetical protein
MTTAACDALLIRQARTVESIVAHGTGGSKAAEPIHDAVRAVEREIEGEKEPSRG